MCESFLWGIIASRRKDEFPTEKEPTIMTMNNAFNNAVSTASTHARRLGRSRTNRWIGGVAGGLAETYGWNPALVRAVFAATLLFPIPGSQILMYLLAWLLIPQR